METKNEITQAQKPQTLKELMATPLMMNKLKEVWNTPQMAAAFASSVISVVNGNETLRKADPMSVASAAMVAATLKLQINPNLGHAYLIPYYDRKKALPQCQFQLGYKGLLQLCLRSGQVKKVIAEPVHEGELISGDAFNEDYVFDTECRSSDTVTGYMVKVVLINGFEKTAYWTKEKVEAHAKRFSQAYSSGYGTPWKSDFDAMALKTVLKAVLKYMPVSVEMTQAVTFDQAVVKPQEGAFDGEEITIDAFTPEYSDNPESKDGKRAALNEVAEAAAAKEGALL